MSVVHLSSLEATLSAKLVLAGGGGRSERDRDVQQARAGLKAECRRLMIEQPELARTLFKYVVEALGFRAESCRSSHRCSFAARFCISLLGGVAAPC